MTLLSTLLRTTAERYQTAAQAVLQSWTPECGCARPGMAASCESCPSLAIFRQRVSLHISAQVEGHTTAPSAQAVEAASPTKAKAATVPSTSQSMETPHYDARNPRLTPSESAPRTHKSKQQRNRKIQSSGAKSASA